MRFQLLIALTGIIFILGATTAYKLSLGSGDIKYLSPKITPFLGLSPSPETQKEAIAAPGRIIPKTTKIKMLKDVGEAYMDYFGLQENDFAMMKNAGVNLIEGNFDICATDEDVKFFLDKSQKYNLKVIMPAGAGEAEWGYTCDQEPFPAEQKPVWQKEQVTTWINKWKSHSAIYGWDTSNEAGSVFPNASEEKLDHYLTGEQLKQAYRDVKSADSNRPVMIRMNGWFFYDYDNNFFRGANPFDRGIADLVMVNAYSNVEEYFPDFVTTVTSRAKSALQKVDPKVQIIIALGAWKEPPLWVKPTADHLNQDIAQLRGIAGIKGVAYFKYGAAGSEWYLPDNKIGAPELWQIISQNSL